MEVILCQDVKTLGKAGQVVKVKEGYARNYLLPRSLAYLATQSNLKKIEAAKARIVAQEEKRQKEAEELAKKLSGVSCTVNVEVNDLEKLYGSVTVVDIVKALEAEGYKIDKELIILERPIEELGIYEVTVQLCAGVETKVRVWVTKK